MDEELLRQFDDEVRRNCRFLGRKVERLERVTRITGPTAYQLDNFIFWTDFDSATADTEIETHVSHFDALGHNFVWIVCGHDQPPDLVDRLLARGLEHESEEQVVIAEARSLGEQSLPPGVELRTIDDPADVPDVVAVADAVWGGDQHDFLTRWLTEMVRDHNESSTILVAYAQQQPIAAAWAFLWPDRAFAPLFGGSVIPQWRGRGIYRAMVAARAKAAADRGIRWCLVDAGPKSEPILKRLGFRVLTERKSLRRVVEGFEIN